MIGMKIGELAKSTGTAVETIRYYEKIGLMPQVARTEGNYRSYGSDEAERLGFIRRARNLGFGIDQVRALLSLADNHDRECGEVDRLAKAHLAEVESKIAGLTALKIELSATIDRCRSGTIAQCQILKALAAPADSNPR
jgi:Cu(I)-responsive transcriptional regulator